MSYTVVDGTKRDVLEIFENKLSGVPELIHSYSRSQENKLKDNEMWETGSEEIYKYSVVA